MGSNGVPAQVVGIAGAGADGVGLSVAIPVALGDLDRTGGRRVG